MRKADPIYWHARRKIESGEWETGQQIDLDALMDEFDCTRETVRRALRTLVVEGKIASHRGTGFFVGSKVPQEIFDKRRRQIGQNRLI